MFQYIKTVGFS